MNFLFACPKCDKTAMAVVEAATESYRCMHCDQEFFIPRKALTEDPEGVGIQQCVVCPSSEFYVRKDFSQRLGVTIIVLGIIFSTITWSQHMIVATFAIFFGSALLDLFLYMAVGNMLQCYRCQAQYRDVAGLNEHSPFSLETHEKYRQEAARLAEVEDV